VASAGFTQSGEENDAAAGQVIMNVLGQISQETGALALGIDHFGKNPETGTRGTSAKEGAADVVLALLGTKSISGEITNTLMAARKRRSGPSGEEFHFKVRSVDLGVDRYGSRVTSLVVDWKGEAASGGKPAEPADRWAKSLRLLRQVLMNVLVDHGVEQRPFPDGPLVRTVDIEIVRIEFHRSYVADGDTEQKKQAARRKAFYRAIYAAQAASLVGIRELSGSTLIWLASAKEERDG
jgi:hypothetical protein